MSEPARQLQAGRRGDARRCAASPTRRSSGCGSARSGSPRPRRATEAVQAEVKERAMETLRKVGAEARERIAAERKARAEAEARVAARRGGARPGREGFRGAAAALAGRARSDRRRDLEARSDAEQAEPRRGRGRERVAEARGGRGRAQGQARGGAQQIQAEADQPDRRRRAARRRSRGRRGGVARDRGAGSRPRSSSG